MKKIITTIAMFVAAATFVNAQQTFTNNFGAYEPTYFIAGFDKPVAKFQLSFKYRLLSDDGYVAQKQPWMKSLTFAYTQRSIWDISAESSPFYDTSYMPEFFAETPTVKIGRVSLKAQAGYKHESNGKGGIDSRSMNLLTTTVTASADLGKGWSLTVAPRAWWYIGTMRDNPDLDNYRGYGDLTISVGKNDGLKVTAYGRAGYNLRNGAIQIDATYPVGIATRDLAAYFLVQYWNGYGESLLAYNRTSNTVRFGLAIVR